MKIFEDIFKGVDAREERQWWKGAGGGDYEEWWSSRHVVGIWFVDVSSVGVDCESTALYCFNAFFGIHPRRVPGHSAVSGSYTRPAVPK